MLPPCSNDPTPFLRPVPGPFVILPLVILHLGLGSFHRAHQAAYLHQLQQLGDSVWVLKGGNIRSEIVQSIDALIAQQGQYTLETVSARGERTYLRVASIQQVIPWQVEQHALIGIGADPQTRIISFTVTEAGYYLDDTDCLQLKAADIVFDLNQARNGRAGRTIYSVLVAILRERMRQKSGPITLLCCDNLRHNGCRSRSGLIQFIQTLEDPSLLEWVISHTTSPNSMVDRITPRPSAEVVERVRKITGREDPAALMAESFCQWVIEDHFINGRPGWERVGVDMVTSVAPYEEAKIRLLNATHSCIAWAGTLLGYRYIHEGILDPGVRAFAFNYCTRDAIPVLEPSPIDLAAYRDVILERFANPAIQDTNQRVAMDGFSKIPGFITPTIRDRLALDQSIEAVAVLPALFLAYLQLWHQGALPYEYQDQVMNRDAAHEICADADPVASLVADRVLWGDLAGDARLLSAIRAAQIQVEQWLSAALELRSHPG